MAQNSIEVEAGKVGLVHTGMWGTPGTPQGFDSSRMAFIVLNDPTNIRYEIYAGSDSEIVAAGTPSDNTVVLATAPGVDPNLPPLVTPDRLFNFTTQGLVWPTLLYETGEKKLEGAYQTAFVLLADPSVYGWTNTVQSGVGLTTLDLPAGCTVQRTLRGQQPGPILSGKSIDRIVVKKLGGTQPDGDPTAWPP